MGITYNKITPAGDLRKQVIAMRHSNRLTSLTSHVVFVVVGLAGASTTLVNHFNEAWVRYGVIP
jgi:hypothetical protein